MSLAATQSSSVCIRRRLPRPTARLGAWNRDEGIKASAGVHLDSIWRARTVVPVAESA